MEHELEFISVYRYLMTERGLTKMSYYMDVAHLSQKIMPKVLNILEKKTEGKFKIPILDLFKIRIVNLCVAI